MTIQPVGSWDAPGMSGVSADLAHIHADPNPVPADFGWVAWTIDPRYAGVGYTPAAGNIALSAFWLRKPAAAFSNITIQVSTAGATLTANECFCGIYDWTGTLLGTTADQSGNWTSLGRKTMPLTSPYPNPQAGMYWAAFLANGTTIPAIRAGVGSASTSVINTGLPSPWCVALPVALAGTGTTLPATISLGSLAESGAAPFTAVIT